MYVCIYICLYTSVEPHLYPFIHNTMHIPLSTLNSIITINSLLATSSTLNAICLTSSWCTCYLHVISSNRHNQIYQALAMGVCWCRENQREERWLLMLCPCTFDGTKIWLLLSPIIRHKLLYLMLCRLF